jgi:hypothetical protein
VGCLILVELIPIMITRGYWCDECRRKYVAHMCKDRTMPCRHSYELSFFVECQAFRRSGERVTIEWGALKAPSYDKVWLTTGDRPRQNFLTEEAFDYWGVRVMPFGGSGFDLWVGEWLASKPDAFVRAFLNRWESSKWTPGWLTFRNHPDAKQACALVPIAGRNTPCNL